MKKLSLALAIACASSASFAADDLYFSEYIEGSSNNKALEIFNGTGGSVDLAAYEVQMYFNGNTSAGLTLNLTGMVEDGEVFVVAQSNAVDDILSQADQTSGAGWFNGDDAVVLLNGGIVVDSIGQIGVDPGSEWGSDETSTQNNTLRRSAIASGDNNPSDSFDPSAEWQGFATDSFEDLGTYAEASDGSDGDTTRNIIINEVDADTSGTDTMEFIELYDGGLGNTVLDGLVLVFFNGNSDTSYRSFDLSGYSTDDNGYFVLGNELIPNVSIVFPSNGLQNGADAVALYEGDAANYANGTTVTTENLIDAVVYDTNDADDPGLSILLSEGEYQLNEDELSNKDEHSNQRCETGYLQAFATPGAENNCAPVIESACGEPATLIHDIQGSGFESPLAGQFHSVEAVVVADFQAGGQLSGFYIQEEDADNDADPMTSEGLFVYDTNNEVSVGDLVRLTGTVGEYYGMTQLSSVSSLEVCATDMSVSAAELMLPVESTATLESVEGMSIVVPQTLTVSENYNLGRYGELVLSNGRLFNPTNIAAPGEAAMALQAANNLNRVVLDDASRAQNPDPIVYPNPGLSAYNTVRGGDLVTGVEGVLEYAFSEYRIQPTNEPSFVSNNPRTSAPLLPGEGSLTVASFNVLNYFNGDGFGEGFPTDRGADTAEELQRQEDKIVNAILAMNADIVGLMEIENDGFGENSAIATLVNALNSAGGDYAYIDPGLAKIGSDAIAVGLIYQPSQVEPQGLAHIIDSSIDSRFNDDKNRPALIQTFKEIESNGVLTVAVNHLKSKGSSCDDLGDPDMGDGQGNCNLTRTAAANALADYLSTDPTSSQDEDILIIGDLNAYAKEDPVSAILDKGYQDLISEFVGDQAYSYVFYGQAGSLDHALASNSLSSQVTGLAEWHINTDEPRVLDYNTEYKSEAQIFDLYSTEPYRASDHDPVIVEIKLKSSIKGDFNENGRLDIRDFFDLLKHTYCDIETCAEYDLNDDGKVSFKDVREWFKLLRESRRG